MNQQHLNQIGAMVLRISGILTIFVGLILCTQTLIQMMSFQSALAGLPGGVTNVNATAGKLGLWGLLANASIIFWGLILTAFSNRFAVCEPDSPEEPAFTAAAE